MRKSDFELVYAIFAQSVKIAFAAAKKFALRILLGYRTHCTQNITAQRIVAGIGPVPEKCNYHN